MFLQETKNVIKKKYIIKGTYKFNQLILALFLGGFSTFSILYSVQSILPIFSQKFFLTPAESSIALSSATIMMAFGTLFTGPLSDIMGRKLIMSVSLFFSAICTILCANMNNWNDIILLRALTGLSLSGVVSVAMTYISEEIDPSSLSYSIGLYISGNTIGGFFGRLLSSFLAETFSWNTALMIIGYVSLISSFLFLYLLPSSKNFCLSKINLQKFLMNYYLHLKNVSLLKIFFIGFILMGSFITIFNYINYRLMLQPFFLSQSHVGYISIIYLIGVYSSPQAGILIQKYHFKKILTIGLFLMIIGILMTQKNNLYVIFLGLIIFSGGFFASHSVASSWVSTSQNIAKVQATSLYLFFYYLGSSLFGTFGGFFWSFGEWFGISIFVLIILFLAFFLSIQLKKKI